MLSLGGSLLETTHRNVRAVVAELVCQIHLCDTLCAITVFATKVWEGDEFCS